MNANGSGSGSKVLSSGSVGTYLSVSHSYHTCLGTLGTLGVAKGPGRIRIMGDQGVELSGPQPQSPSPDALGADHRRCPAQPIFSYNLPVVRCVVSFSFPPFTQGR